MARKYVSATDSLRPGQLDRQIASIKDRGHREIERKIGMKEMKKVLRLIEKEFSADHCLILHPNGICGIEACTGVVEINFSHIEELFEWVVERSD